MKTILVATDFSTRSDRAIRRGVLLAKQFDASMCLMHAVDDDQPQRFVTAHLGAADKLLAELSKTTQEVDGIECTHLVVLGDPFLGILEAGDQVGADLQVIGAHRRQLLRDIFTGTTAERTIRQSVRPTLMTNAVPTAPYRHALLGVDFSENCRHAIRKIETLRLAEKLVVSPVHIFDVPVKSLMSRSALRPDDIEAYVMGERRRAEGQMTSFLHGMKLNVLETHCRQTQSTVANTLFETASELGVDLMVVGAHGTTGIAKFLLGSVAEALLREAQIDVLVVPPQSTTRNTTTEASL